MRSFRSEWVKLARVRQVLAVWGLMIALMLLLTSLIFLNAGTEADRAAAAAKAASGQRGGGPVILISELQKADGLTSVMRFAGNILGIVTLVLFAGNLAGEYSNGTLKALLSRQPHRLRLLSGKLAALFSFSILGIVLAALAEMGTAGLIASSRHFDTSAWWTGSNLYVTAAIVGRLIVGNAVWAALGAVLAILFRSGPAAIGIGIGYVIVGEGLLSLAIPDVVRYLPGQVIAAFESHGVASNNLPNPITYGAAAGFMALYLVVFLGTAGIVFWRRDVAN